jgi:hypothetical protein
LSDRKIVSLTLSHAMAGAVVYGGAVAATAAGAVTATITLPGAAILTGTALTAALIAKLLKKTFGK